MCSRKNNADVERMRGESKANQSWMKYLENRFLALSLLNFVTLRIFIYPFCAVVPLLSHV